MTLCFLAAVFCALFLSFELLHPLDDLLRAGSLEAAAAGETASPGSRGEDLPSGEAHGPFLTSHIALTPCAGAAILAPLPQDTPLGAPVLEPPPHIPISGRLTA